MSTFLLFIMVQCKHFTAAIFKLIRVQTHWSQCPR